MRSLGMTTYFWGTVVAAFATMFLAVTHSIVPAMVTMAATGVFYVLYVARS